ncbi:hypothetical protein ACI2L4_02175 [Streptomyces sparsogenes]|uniref:hypothetical protein n=1 Tax=Streptomyces sparsogenes TaxID=67365 RepID=UPI0033D5E890
MRAIAPPFMVAGPSGARERRIAEGRPSVVVGGRRPAKLRHRLDQAHLTAGEWRGRWEAARLFLTADGESGAPHGNYTITVDPTDGSVTILLPEPLRHLAGSSPLSDPPVGSGHTWPTPDPLPQAASADRHRGHRHAP